MKEPGDQKRDGEFTIFFIVSAPKKEGKGKWKSYDDRLRRIVNVSM